MAIQFLRLYITSKKLLLTPKKAKVVCYYHLDADYSIHGIVDIDDDWYLNG